MGAFQPRFTQPDFGEYVVGTSLKVTSDAELTKLSETLRFVQKFG